ncbi:MAG: hypothetical protein EZS28_002164 [Streblomastix strix]|uniref:Uncharacterized protein n=1 Tax=Streblomastix strix TaxID=222440 RepID=A0A5J4X671_9EUKA|nr:MAG: hypothetical protein EZS28_002164 [Streblomastix strix]
MGNSTSTVSAQASPVPTEYNVVNGLIGLGEYILMEILSGMPGHRDVQQFVGHQNGSIEGNNHFKYNGEKIALEV